MVVLLEVRLKEGWFDMGILKKALNVVSPVASVINKSGPVAKMLGMQKQKGSTGSKGGFGSMAASLANDPKVKNALQEGQARIAPKKMSKGGAMHKMPDGTMMKGAVHKAASGKYIEKKKKAKSGSSASKRADGCAVKGKTKGRMV
jgi:hypothetical protein